MKISKRVIVIVTGFILSVILILTSGFFRSAEYEIPYYLMLDEFNIERARILYTDNSRLSPDPYIDRLYLGIQTIEIEVLSGEFRGQRFRIENTLNRFFNHMAAENMVMLFNIRSNDGVVLHINMFGYTRNNFVFAFIGIFFAALIAVGRMKGLYSVLSLMFTSVMVVFFLIPFILRGHNPILMAVLTAALTTVFAIFLVSDVSLKSFAAIGGTIAGVAIAGVISVIAGSFARISGMQMHHVSELIYHVRDLDVRIPELLFAGIVISALGAVMDVSVSISSAVFEMKELNPEMDVKRLYKSAMNIGRDIIGTMSNTLILAFAGSSLIMMIIIAMSRFPYVQFINLNVLAIELIQAVSASIGLVLAVPLTAVFSAVLAVRGEGLTA